MSSKRKEHARERSFAIDSNTFRSLDFINFLITHVEHFDIYLPSIVMLEVGYYFMSKGISWDGFTMQLKKLDAKPLDWGLIEYRMFLEHCIAHKARLPYIVHFRDYLIGSQCLKGGIDLVTHNDRHLDWCTGINVLTPAALGAQYL